MKLIITFFFLLVGYSAIDAQTTFNRRYSFGSDNCTINYVHATDSCYYIAGVINDSINPVQLGLLFAKIDLNGAPIFIKKISSPFETVEYRNGSMPLTQDNHFLLSGYGKDSTIGFYAALTKITLDGDIIWTRKFTNPIDSPRAVLGWDVIERQNKEIIFTNTVYDTTTSLVQSHVLARYLDSMGIEYSGAFFTRSPYSESAPSIYKNKYQNSYVLINEYHFFYQALYNSLREIDSSGAMVWQDIPNFYQLFTPNDLIFTLDTGYVVAASNFYRDPIEITTNTQPCVYKLDKNRQVVWMREFKGHIPFMKSQIERVFERSDSSIIAIGTSYMALNVNNTQNISFCGIYKLSADGDSLWGRKFYLLNQHGQNNLVHDARQTSDGGFIICGETGGGLLVNEPQRGWLLKVDSMGCLTPGCHLLAAEAIATAEPKIQIYPNPAQESANISMSLLRESTGYLVLYDALGHELRRQPFAGQEATFVLDISGYASGLYFVSIEVAGALPVVRQLVKM